MIRHPPQVFRLRLFQTYSISSSVSDSISSGSAISSQSSKDCLEIRIMLPMRMILNAPILKSLLFVRCTHNDLQSMWIYDR